MDKQAIIKALRDTAQSASNSVAETASAPIDAITWALRKAGLPVPENAVGSSDWMAQKGLTAPVEAGIPKMAGEVLGNVVPAIGFAKAPQIARGMNRMVDNAMAPATMNKQSGKVFVYPQDEALATAQRNAAKPVSEGGLGLRPDNTAMERAKAMGFDTNTYHGTKSDIKAFEPSRGGEYGSGVYSASDPSLAHQFAEYANGLNGSTVMPLVSRAKNPLITNDRNIPRAIGPKGLAKKGFDSVEGISASGERQTVTLNPSFLRSRFAAFDPARVNEADILGRADPALLGLIGLGAGAAAYGNNK